MIRAKRPNQWPTAIFFVGILAGAADALGASPGMIVRLSPGGWEVQHDLPFLAVVLVGGRALDGGPVYAVKTVATRQRTHVGWGPDIADAAIIAWAGADPRLRIRETNDCGGYALDPEVLAEFEHRMDGAQVAETAAGRAAVSTAAEAGRLRAESWKAMRDFEMDNPLRQDYLERLRVENPYAYQEVKRQDLQKELLTFGLAENSASAEAMDERKMQWGREAELLRPFLDRLRDYEKNLVQVLRAMASGAEAARQFGRAAYDALQAGPAAPPDHARRQCAEPPSAIIDNIVVEAQPGTQSYGALRLEVRFDDGSTALAVAHPVMRPSSKWLASTAWPPRATSAEVFARQDGNNRKSLGRIQSGRTSADAMVRTIEKARRDAERRLKAAKQLSKTGGAENTGIVIY